MTNKQREQIRKLIKRYRIESGKGFALKHIDPGDTHEVPSKGQGEDLLRTGIELLTELQDKLYAQDRWTLLLVFQAMDAAGKDGTIKHVMSGVKPQGCEVYSFKAPSSTDLDHDYLWRTMQCLPERGRIGIFNRSYYEEVLVVRVHPGILASQKIPAPLVTKHIWRDRFEDINDVRALPDAQRHRDSQILPPRLEGRAAQAFSRAPGATRTRTGSSPSPTPRSAASGRTTCAHTRT